MSHKYLYDTFLSHSSGDKPVVEKLAMRLEQAGCKPFLDKWHLVPGEPWQEALKAAIQQSATCVVFLGPSGLGAWENEEMRYILDERVKNKSFRVIPVLLPGADIAGQSKLPPFLRRLTWVDFRSGLSDRDAFNRLLSGIKGIPPGTGQSRDERIFVECSDIAEFQCDVVVLKYAQNFYGADAQVAALLVGDIDIIPRPGKYSLVRSHKAIAANYVLFAGVLDLYAFDYAQVREFATRTLHILSKELPGCSHVAMTMQGIGYGLDERESFISQIAGLTDAFQKGLVPDSLERVSIVEINSGRAQRLRDLLGQYYQSVSAQGKWSIESPPDVPEVGVTGAQSNSVPHVFVAMPFSDSMEDVFVFGIQGPINTAGYLCERVDMATFTGDILTRIKSRIETATLVVADLTGANANVYLEVGYAWGKERPTLLITQNSEELKFDVRGQRCIAYKNINDLAKKLSAFLGDLKI